MKMVPVPEQAYGNFFEGDCYIILNVSNLVFILIHMMLFSSF